MIDYLFHYEKYMPAGMNNCVVNKICRIFENEFDGYLSKKYTQPVFDYTIMKSNVGYTKAIYNEISIIFGKYQNLIESYKKESSKQRTDSSYDAAEKYHRFAESFKMECEKICTNEDELCDIVLDLCYQSTKTKQFAWDVCGQTILNNLLKKNNYTIHIPVHVDCEGDFEYCGEQFKMIESVVEIGGDEDDYT